jgi:hypothetical protein
MSIAQHYGLTSFVPLSSLQPKPDWLLFWGTTVSFLNNVTGEMKKGMFCIS